MGPRTSHIHSSLPGRSKTDCQETNRGKVKESEQGVPLVMCVCVCERMFSTPFSTPLVIHTEEGIFARPLHRLLRMLPSTVRVLDDGVSGPLSCSLPLSVLITFTLFSFVSLSRLNSLCVAIAPHVSAHVCPTISLSSTCFLFMSFALFIPRSVSASLSLSLSPSLSHSLSLSLPLHLPLCPCLCL